MIVNFADNSANERTFLAWVRTAIAIVGFGLAFSRIGAGNGTFWTEMALLSSGAFVVLVAFLRMRHVRRKIADMEQLDDDALAADGLLLVLVAGLFLMLGAFVVKLR
ncbi:MAG TPA: DUF202 domain-containing protein [Rhodobacteraceae bacterium]|jgi:putative membrane protein|nr:DUF202 domain-containing protein [Rhodobacter sp.]HBN29929.1 DUF202 domain-containing protein [Paracoccaceae bacterium]